MNIECYDAGIGFALRIIITITLTTIHIASIIVITNYVCYHCGYPYLTIYLRVRVLKT